MRVLITGGGGFLAGHLAAHLQTLDGIELRSLRRSECDIASDREKLCEILRGFKPGTVLHLAGRINGSESELDRDNRLATEILFESIRKESLAAKIVLGSTVAVYRDAGTVAAPLTEGHPAGPRGLYGTSKYAAERHARSHAEQGGWIVTARMTNPVGPNMDANLLCGTLAKQIVEIERGKPPILTLRDLTPKRDFISALDCVRALWHLARFGECGAIYNVACGVSASIAEIVEIYLRLARVRPIEVRTLPVNAERSSVKTQWVSNAKLLSIGWKPRVSVDEAIRHHLAAERARA